MAALALFCKLLLLDLAGTVVASVCYKDHSIADLANPWAGASTAAAGTAAAAAAAGPAGAVGVLSRRPSSALSRPLSARSRPSSAAGSGLAARPGSRPSSAGLLPLELELGSDGDRGGGGGEGGGGLHVGGPPGPLLLDDADAGDDGQAQDQVQGGDGSAQLLGVPGSLPPLLNPPRIEAGPQPQQRRPTSASAHSPGPGSGTAHLPGAAVGVGGASLGPATRASLLVARPAPASGVRFAEDEGP